MRGHFACTCNGLISEAAEPASRDAYTMTASPVVVTETVARNLRPFGATSSRRTIDQECAESSAASLVNVALLPSSALYDPEEAPSEAPFA